MLCWYGGRHRRRPSRIVPRSCWRAPFYEAHTLLATRIKPRALLTSVGDSGDSERAARCLAALDADPSFQCPGEDACTDMWTANGANARVSALRVEHRRRRLAILDAAQTAELDKLRGKVLEAERHIAELKRRREADDSSDGAAGRRAYGCSCGCRGCCGTATLPALT